MKGLLGIPLRDLLRRTWGECWQDEVFGQAGRMAFYHFLALFPLLLFLLALLTALPSWGAQEKPLLAQAAQQFLPWQSCVLLQQVAREMNRNMPSGFRFATAAAGALWAACNGTWALIYGLNTAYEVKEARSWWKVTLLIGGLTLLLAVAGACALLLLFSAAHVRALAVALRVVDWALALALVAGSLLVVYRFAPNLAERRWRWTIPGAICAWLLWIIASVGVRVYFQNINDYTRTYGHVNSVVMLLLWLYLTNAAVLIGAEMNSELQKTIGDRQNDRSGS